MDPRGTGWPIPHFSRDVVVWRPPTTIEQIDGPGGVFAATVVEAHALHSLGSPPAMQTGVSFCVETTASGRAAVVPLTIFDQGRALLGKKKYKTMGRGVRVSTVKQGCSGQAETIPAHTKLLTFVIVAKAPLCDDGQLAALYAHLRHLGIGSGHYLALSPGNTMCIYDTEYSTAHLVNNALFDPALLRRDLKIKPANNLHMVVPSAPDIFTAAWETTKGLRAGDHLFGPYGSSSPLNREIRKAQAETKARNALLSPEVNAKRARGKEVLIQARAAKKAKRDAHAAVELA